VTVRGPSDSIYGLSLGGVFLLRYVISGVAAMSRLRRYSVIVTEGIYVDRAATLQATTVVAERTTRADAREAAESALESIRSGAWRGRPERL
jgi:hypothetical protein